MNCKQRLCKRNKNLTKSGYCNICDDLAEEVKKKYTSKEKPTVDVLIEKLQEVEIENLTNKTRLEALENWMSQITEHNDKTKADDNDASDREPNKNTVANENVKTMQGESNVTKEKPFNKQHQSTKCKTCKETFSKNFELEKHMVFAHNSEKPYACETCDKTFFLKWRLKKHISVHQGSVQTCKFVKEGIFCPFEEVGCKFKHEELDNGVRGHDSNEGYKDLEENVEAEKNENDEEADAIEIAENEDDEATEVTDDNCELTEDEMMTVESDNDDESVVCCYCGNWFDRNSLLFHMKENHMQVLHSQYPGSFLPSPLVPEQLWQRQHQQEHAEQPHPQQPQSAVRRRQEGRCL